MATRRKTHIEIALAAWGRRYEREAAKRAKAAEAKAGKEPKDADKKHRRVSEEIACVLAHN